MIKKNIEIASADNTEFCQRFQVNRMALFGSALRDDFHPDSDVDVLVQFVPDARVSFTTLGMMKRELETISQRPVDLVPQDGLTQ